MDPCPLSEGLWLVGCRYGPFWVTTTVVFMTAVSSNIVNYWDYYQQSEKDKEWTSDLSKVRFIHQRRESRL